MRRPEYLGHSAELIGRVVVHERSADSPRLDRRYCFLNWCAGYDVDFRGSGCAAQVPDLDSVAELVERLDNHVRGRLRVVFLSRGKVALTYGLRNGCTFGN